MLKHMAKSPVQGWENEDLNEVLEEEGVKNKKRRFSFRHRKTEKPPKAPLTKAQKKKRRKRILWAVAAAAVLAVTVVPKFFAAESLPMVGVAEAGLGSVQQTVEGSGTVKSGKIQTFFSPVTATVAAFDLRVGDTVEAGETLLTYDGTELDELYKQADLTGSAANYNYQDAINRNRENVAEYNRSSAALTTIEEQLEDEKDENEHVQNRIVEYSGKQADAQLIISQQEAVRSDAQSKIDQANMDKKAAQAEKEQASLSSNQMTAAAADAVIANADKVIAEQTRIRDGALKKIEEQQKELQAIHEKLNGYEDRLEASSENLEDLQTRKAKEQGIQDSSDAGMLSSAQQQELKANNTLSSLNAQMTKDDINAGKGGIQAEFSGVVTEVFAVAGGPAAQGSSLFTIASNESVIVDMSVTRYDLEKLEVGQSAEISLAGKTYVGTVSKLSRVAVENEKGTPVVSAEIRVENPDEDIYLGLEAKVTVMGRQAQDVIVVPVEAVNTGKDGSFCYVVENGTVVKRVVETGLSSATMVEILSGLSLGDNVIRNGAGTVEEGMKVTAVEE